MQDRSAPRVADRNRRLRIIAKTRRGIALKDAPNTARTRLRNIEENDRNAARTNRRNTPADA